ncbi:hypothetical protein BU17DRAFT_63052 [Hysterangium stoloniferum]|nr:hypothetical protein BU17DRAFT_63052 [Hysterangium stoloniferum]
MSSHSRYSSLYGSNHPSTHSMNADVLQNEVVQNAFLSSNYGEVQNTPTRFLEQSGSCLVDGILKRYPSAGQHNINRDLTLLWEGEQYPFPYDERNDNDGPSRESSIGPIVTFPHPTSSTHPSPSSTSTASTHHKNALTWPQAPPTDCPWGDIYDVNGNMGKCVWKSALLTQAKTLQHWAWYHVTNDVFAFQTGILTDLQEAKIVNTPEKLECAILHLGLCPNEACQQTVPRTVRAYRRCLIKKHLKRSPECKPFFEHLSVKGYRELGKQLGYVWPGPKSQPQRQDIEYSAAKGRPMGFSGVPASARESCLQCQLIQCWHWNYELQHEKHTIPTICSSSSIRGGNQVFDYGSLIPRVREPSSSQVTIEDYDERFGIVPPNSSTHGNQFQIQSPYRTAHPTGMQEAYISSHSSLTGCRVAVSGSMATNLASLVNPGSSDPAPAFSTPGHSLSSINLSSLLKVAGDDIIRVYWTKYFTTGIIEASGDFLSNKNAINWIIESSTSASALPLRQYKRQRGSSTSSEHSVVIANKRLQRVSGSPPPITWVTPNKSTGTSAKKHARYSKHQAMTDAGWIQITRQQWVTQLVELTEIPTTSLPSSSYHPTSTEPFYASLPPELEPPTSAEPFYASLPPELEPPTSAEPFYASLPPKLEPPPSSYSVHLSYLQQSRLYTNSEPVFPSATCPPNLRSNQ